MVAEVMVVVEVAERVEGAKVEEVSVAVKAEATVTEVTVAEEMAEAAMVGEVTVEVAMVVVAAVVATHTAPSPQKTACCVRHPRPRQCTSPQTSCPRIPAQAGRRAALHGSPAHQ